MNLTLMPKDTLIRSLITALNEEAAQGLSSMKLSFELNDDGVDLSVKGHTNVLTTFVATALFLDKESTKTYLETVEQIGEFEGGIDEKQLDSSNINMKFEFNIDSVFAPKVELSNFNVIGLLALLVYIESEHGKTVAMMVVDMLTDIATKLYKLTQRVELVSDSGEVFE